jgi:hypothetical protein
VGEATIYVDAVAGSCAFADHHGAHGVANGDPDATGVGNAPAILQVAANLAIAL